MENMTTTLSARNPIAANLIVEIETIANTEDTLHNRIRNALTRWATTSATISSPDTMKTVKDTIRDRIKKVHDNPYDHSPRVLELWRELAEDI